MPSIAVLGTTGQVARAWRAWAISQKHYQCEFFGRDVFDFASLRFEDLERLKRFDVVVNTVAYTKVDKAESEKELAIRVNAESVQLLAKFAKENDKWLVHYSTDYVYAGTGVKVWHEADLVHPPNVYGESKLKGDEYVLAQQYKAVILRTSWVYDEDGANFLNTMLRLGGERDELKVVSDQRGAPTYAFDLVAASANVIDQLLKRNEKFCEILHCCNSGETSWYDFAQAIFQEARQKNLILKVQKVTPIATAEYPTPAKRPLNSRLSLEKIRKLFGIQMPSWQDALHRCFERKYGNH